MLHFSSLAAGSCAAEDIRREEGCALTSHECIVLREFFVAVRLRSFDDVPFLLDRNGSYDIF
ncbi:hypothetical protein KFK09_027332 [Dendrobium nobile]|uniref:Uncharacterized protein n=1 Tax=Dendrobium nobile TaxID=94219 RepID=A0A8T3A930_DENNO|nr:hypothetical protein KFK09_027332 [Dendrobium nobile]